MEWTMDYLEEEGIVLVKTSGAVTLEQTIKMCEEFISFARKHNTHKILADHRDLESSLPILQIDDLPQMLIEIGFGPEDKVAILYDQHKEDKYSFFQSLSNIASLSFRRFGDENKAMAWLKTGG